MISVFKQMRRVGLAVVALGSIGVSGTAFAQNTAVGHDDHQHRNGQLQCQFGDQTPISCESRRSWSTP